MDRFHSLDSVVMRNQWFSQTLDSGFKEHWNWFLRIGLVPDLGSDKLYVGCWKMVGKNGIIFKKLCSILIFRLLQGICREFFRIGTQIAIAIHKTNYDTH